MCDVVCNSVAEWPPARRSTRCLRCLCLLQARCGICKYFTYVLIYVHMYIPTYTLCTCNNVTPQIKGNCEDTINVTGSGKTSLIYTLNLTWFESLKCNNFLSVIHIISKVSSYMRKSMRNSLKLTDIDTYILHSTYRTGDKCHNMNKYILCR